MMRRKDGEKKEKEIEITQRNRGSVKETKETERHIRTERG
jgi:hypothetical protein